MHRSSLTPRSLALVAVVLPFVGVTLVCCSATYPGDATGDGGVSDAAAAETHDAGLCTPKAGAMLVEVANYGFVYLSNALPSGSCSDEGATCQLAALASWMYCLDGGRVPADGGGNLVGCSYSVYQCTCSSLAWSCELVGPGGSACGCF